MVLVDEYYRYVLEAQLLIVSSCTINAVKNHLSKALSYFNSPELLCMRKGFFHH